MPASRTEECRMQGRAAARSKRASLRWAGALRKDSARGASLAVRETAQRLCRSLQEVADEFETWFRKNRRPPNPMTVQVQADIQRMLLADPDYNKRLQKPRREDPGATKKLALPSRRRVPRVLALCVTHDAVMQLLKPCLAAILPAGQLSTRTRRCTAGGGRSGGSSGASRT